MQGKVEIVCHGGLNFVLFVSTYKVRYKTANICEEYFLLKPIDKRHKRKWNE